MSFWNTGFLFYNLISLPIYKFTKEALIRKFGEDWYAELEKVAKKL